MQQPYPDPGGYSDPSQFVDPGASSFGFDAIGATVVGGSLVLALGIVGLILIIKLFLFIARPNEAVVLSGKSFTAPDGTERGYKVFVQGRRGIRIPVLHQLDRMDMRTVPVDIMVHNAYSAGNIPLQIHAIANVKIHSNETYIGNAIERFLGREQREVQLVAQQTLEGSVREVIATMTPEEVNEDRLKFAETLIDSAEDDLHKLGLQLDTLKIQNVSDETGYLDSLGRPQIAAALRDAENAENEAQQQVTQAQAESSRTADVAKATAETAIVEKRNELRRVRAELEGEAQSVEREAEAAAKTARATAEKQVQSLRSELENKRLQADVVIPSELRREARAILAIGQAAPTAENGKAAVEVLRLMGEAWKSMGPQAKEIYVIQHLEEIVGTVVESLDDVRVGEVNVLDPGDGSGLASYASTYPQMVAAVMRALGETTGVDVPAILGAEDAGARARGGL